VGDYELIALHCFGIHKREAIVGSARVVHCYLRIIVSGQDDSGRIQSKGL
jgi:hypothetical protein